MSFTKFQWKQDLCIQCGMCQYVCPGQLIQIENGTVSLQDVSTFGWDGCWKCQHCLAVCPTGAISIFEKHPDDSQVFTISQESGHIMDALIRNRRSCRRYLDKNVNKELLTSILSTVQQAPCGGNKMKVEFTLIDDVEEMNRFRTLAYQRMEVLAKQGIYARTFDEKSYQQMKRWEAFVRPDSLFCGAPHILIPHAPLAIPCANQDIVIAGTYFELLCAANGLGALFMSYPLSVLDLMPDIKELLHIPHDHACSMIIGFGYPEIKYARGVQKEEEGKVHIIKFK